MGDANAITPPTKHESDVRPIISHIDFLRNPIFLLSDQAVDGFDGHFSLKDGSRIVFQGPPLRGKDRDVLHAFIHLAKQSKNLKLRVDYVPHKLLKFMGWPTGRFYYERLRDAINRMYEINIRIEPSSGRDVDLRIFSSKNPLARKLPNDLKEKAFVQLAQPFAEMLNDEKFKQLHPVFFSLPNSTEKRLYELIAVRASDLLVWNVSISTLRDLMPLVGKRYQKSAMVKAQITPNLKSLKNKNIISGFKFEKGLIGGEPYYAIYPNHDYFYSRTHPVKKLGNQRPSTPVSETKSRRKAESPDFIMKIAEARSMESALRNPKDSTVPLEVKSEPEHRPELTKEQLAECEKRTEQRLRNLNDPNQLARYERDGKEGYDFKACFVVEQKRMRQEIENSNSS